MMKQLIKINLTKLAALLLLTFAFSCSNEENFFENNATEASDLKSDEDLAAKITNVNDCNPDGINPGSGTFGNRIYKYKDLGEDDDDVNDASNKSKTREIDDRTCEYNYKQETLGDGKYGVYRLKANSNPNDDLQPRIERAGVTIKSNLNFGTKTELTGIVKIRRVGVVSGDFGSSGTYIAQAKGKYGGSSKDPAIALILVKQKPGDSNKLQFFLERIGTERTLNGEGREVVDLDFEASKGQAVKVKLVNEFIKASDGVTSVHRIVTELQRGNDTNSKKRNVYIVPDACAADDIKIRFGAYRCKGGRAEILWKEGVKITNKINKSGNLCLSGVFKLKNVQTNRYMDGNNSDLVTGTSTSGNDKKFTFIKQGDYYNIDIQKTSGTGTGILRAMGDDKVKVTNLSPRSDTDKSFEIKQRTDGTYSIKSVRYNKYLQNSTSNKVSLTSSGPDSNKRARWKIVRD